MTYAIASTIVTSWLKILTLDTHRDDSEQDLRLSGAKSHQVRAVATGFEDNLGTMIRTYSSC